MFFQTLESIRRKSAHTKRVIAFCISLSVTLILAGIWFTTTAVDLQNKLAGKANLEQIESETNSKVSKTFSPFKNLSATVSNSFGQLKKQISGSVGFSDAKSVATTTSSSTSDISSATTAAGTSTISVATSTTMDASSTQSSVKATSSSRAGF